METSTSLPEAAVLIILLREGNEDKVLLTRRSQNLREHGGEVALPGGKRDTQDTSLYRTALRESMEEVGIRESEIIFKAELSEHYTRAGAKVTPFVVEMRAPQTLCLCFDEIESSKWVPLSLFQRDKRIKTLIFTVMGEEQWSPVYRYDDYEIWGLTSRIMVSFINRFYGDKIIRSHLSAPEETFF